MNRILFISFTRLIFALRESRVTTKDFKAGLFFFGCVRGHVMDPLHSEAEYFEAQKKSSGHGMTMHEWFVWDKKAPYKNTLQYAMALRNAVPKAEEEGRMIWRDYGQGDKWSELFDMVRRFGINLDQEDVGIDGYCYPKAIELLSPHIQVIG